MTGAEGAEVFIAVVAIPVYMGFSFGRSMEE